MEALNTWYIAFILKARTILVALLCPAVYHVRMATQDNYVKTALRLPRELHAKLQDAADATSKSMNAEIVSRLDKSFDSPEHAVLLSAFERLNTDLARLEIEKLAEKAQAARFAFDLRSVCEQLLPHVTSNSEREQLRGFISEASTVVHGASDFESQLVKRIEELTETIRKRNKRSADKPV